MTEQEQVVTEPVVGTVPIPITEPIAEPVVEPKKEIETRLIPVELNNINLKIELRTPITVAENFQETQNIIARLREQFGDNALIEQLSQIVWGTIEKVTISLPQATAASVATAPVVAPQPTQPVPVTIPQTNQDIANYQIQSTQCPWTGNSLKMLDPTSIYKVLYESPQHRNLMTQQDLTMLEAYYRQWYQAETAKTAQHAKLQESFSDLDIPF